MEGDVCCWLSGKEKLGYGKKPIGTSRKQEVGGTSRKKRVVGLWVQNVCKRKNTQI